MHNVIYRWMVLVVLFGLAWQVNQHTVDTLELLRSNQSTQASIMDTQMRIYHYAAGHNAEQRFTDTHGRVLCVECVDMLITQGKLNETHVIITKEEYDELKGK